MKTRNYVETFCYYIHQSGSAEATTWLSQNGAKVNEFLTWSRSYQWPNGR